MQLADAGHALAGRLESVVAEAELLAIMRREQQRPDGGGQELLTSISPITTDAGCWALVTHHSNAAVDALAAGIPVFCEDGAASLLSMPRLADIENPPLPEGRAQFFADLAYCQWSVPEMASGACWDYLIGEHLSKARSFRSTA